MKICFKCKISKTSEEFGSNITQSDGLQSYCKKCRIPYMRKRYKEKSDHMNKIGAKLKFKYKIILMNLLGGVNCVKCDNTNLYHLQIEHKNDDGKTDRDKYRGNMTKMYKSYIDGKEDIDRLQVMCSNCNIEKQLKKYKHLSKFIEEYNAKS